MVVSAIDVGYGNTKYVLCLGEGSIPVCDLFPSVAPVGLAGRVDIGADLLAKRNTVLIEVNGVHYEVGKDALLAQDVSFARILDPKFCLSDPYMALIRGSLFYMNHEVIDLLVLGLPVNTFGQYKAELVQSMQGVHQIPHPDGSGRTLSVHVKNVLVIPQPLGAFFDYAISNSVYKQMKDKMNLVVDPGYYTLDWLLSKGSKPISVRSGAHAGGMSAILRAMADAMSKDLDAPITDVSAIDAAIRSETNPRFYGSEIKMEKYLQIGKAKAREFVAVLASRVGTGQDVDSIILAGGGAHFFQSALQEKFTRHEILLSDDSVYANVRGFYLAGLQKAEQTTTEGGGN